VRSSPLQNQWQDYHNHVPRFRNGQVRRCRNADCARDGAAVDEVPQRNVITQGWPWLFLCLVSLQEPAGSDEMPLHPEREGRFDQVYVSSERKFQAELNETRIIDRIADLSECRG